MDKFSLWSLTADIYRSQPFCPISNQQNPSPHTDHVIIHRTPSFPYFKSEVIFSSTWVNWLATFFLHQKKRHRWRDTRKFLSWHKNPHTCFLPLFACLQRPLRLTIHGKGWERKGGEAGIPNWHRRLGCGPVACTCSTRVPYLPPMGNRDSDDRLLRLAFC